MLSHRDGKPVVVCDGCYGVIGPAELLSAAGALEAGRSYRLATERHLTTAVTKPGPEGPVNGDACSIDCFGDWAKKPPAKRADPEKPPVPSEA